MVEVRRVGLAPRGMRLVRSNRSITIDQFDAIKGDRKFFGDQLHLGNRDTLAKLLLPAERRYATISPDRNPGIELIERRRTGGRAALRLTGIFQN